MSKHFKWSQLLQAIKYGDVDAVKNALFILDYKVWGTSLDNDESAIQIAAKLGKDEIVALLLQHQSIQNLKIQDPTYFVWWAFTTAEENNHEKCTELVLASETFKAYHLDETLKWHRPRPPVGLKAKIVTMRKVVDNHCDESYGDHKYTALVKNSVEWAADSGSGTIFVDGLLPQKFRLDCLEYIEREFSPIHKAILFQDKPALVALLQELTDSDWPTPPNSDMHLVNFSAKSRNVHILKLVYQKAIELGKNEEKKLESICGGLYVPLEVLQLCVENRWIETSFNKTWENRMKSAVDGIREAVAVFILQRFYQQSGACDADHEPSVSHFLHETPHTHSLLKRAILTDQKQTVQVMMDCIGAQRANDLDRIASDAYVCAVQYGRSEMADFFKKNYDIAELRGETCWCKLAASVHQSVVMMERMGRKCPCSGFIPFSIGSSMRLIEYLLHDPSYVKNFINSNRGDYIPRAAGPVPSYTQQEEMKYNLVQYMDYVDLDTFTDLALKSLLPNDNFYLLCLFFQKCSISKRRKFKQFMDGIFISVLHKDKNDQELFHRCVNRSGVRMVDEELVRDASKLALLPGYDSLLKLSQGSSFEYRSLKSDCRVAIRSSIRAASPPICSLTDQILSLALTGVLPRSVVDYLLFRNERLSA